ncbi:MAG: sugar ABC transporter ATP-binding protein [Planctomycetaceae bacterium]
MTTAEPVLLDVRNISRTFGAVTVLDSCCLQIAAGEIHALLGANGAGKSTLVSIIAGLIPPTVGEMTLSGQLYAPRDKQAAEHLGVQIVQQELNLIPTLTVAENLQLNRLPHRWGIVNRRELHERARAALNRFHLHDIPTDLPLGQLGIGHRQLIEIAAALDRQCRLLILDEPTAALTAGESETLFAHLKHLKTEGVGIIYISHRLDEVAAISDRVSILRDGRVVNSGPANELNAEEMVLRMSDVRQSSSKSDGAKSSVTDRAAMTVAHLSCGPVRDVSFTVYQGERLGIAGLVGSGRTELLRAIFGADTMEAGEVILPERPARRYQHPSDAASDGIAMLTEDRKANGLLLPSAIRSNISLSSISRQFSRFGLIRQQQEDDAAETIVHQLDIRCTGIQQPAEQLSGGNQQKVVMGRWLVRDADVFLLDEPTRGIDVAARRQIHLLLQSLAQTGKALVIVSSDTSELLEICDRILVMSGGQLTDEIRRPESRGTGLPPDRASDWTEDRINRAAFQRPQRQTLVPTGKASS